MLKRKVLLSSVEKKNSGIRQIKGFLQDHTRCMKHKSSQFLKSMQAVPVIPQQYLLPLNLKLTTWQDLQLFLVIFKPRGTHLRVHIDNCDYSQKVGIGHSHQMFLAACHVQSKISVAILHQTLCFLSVSCPCDF